MPVSGKRRRDSILTLRMTSIAAAMLALAGLLAACSGGSSLAPIHKSPGPAPTPTVTLGLWVTNAASPDVIEFSASQTMPAGVSSPVPTLKNNSPSFFQPTQSIFDTSGNLWVVDSGGDSLGVNAGIFEFSVAQLAALATAPNPIPVFAITNSDGKPGFTSPSYGAFDSAGNLYVSDTFNNLIYVFSAAQLSSGDGTGITAAAIFQIVGSQTITGMTFDSAGDLFLLDLDLSAIYVVDKANIPTSSVSVVNVTADVSLESNGLVSGASIDTPIGLVFDTAGNLWFTNQGLGSQPSITEFAAASLSLSGTPTPEVQIFGTAVGSGFSLSTPSGISFDNLGDLAVANSNPDGVSIFSPAQLARSGSPVPNVFIESNANSLFSPSGLVFGPNVP